MNTREKNIQYCKQGKQLIVDYESCHQSLKNDELPQLKI